jgi:hypothetical protein
VNTSRIVPIAIALLCFRPTLAQTKLERKFDEGATYVVRSESNFKQTLTLGGMPVDTQASNVVTQRFSVGKRDAAGVLPVAVKFEALQASLSLPGGINVSFDSSNPAPAPPNSAVSFLFDVYRAIVGSTITYQLDSKNAVAFVQGADGIVGKVTGPAAAMLKQEFDPARLSKTFQQDTDRFPPEPLTKGKTWRRDALVPIGSGQTFTFDTEYEYLGTVDEKGKALDKIGISIKNVRYAIDPNSSLPVKVANSQLKADVSRGEILFDRARGIALRETNKVHITGTMTLTINNMDLPATLDLTMDGRDSVLE